MPVNLAPPSHLQSIAGIQIGTARAGIKPSAQRDDLTLFALAPESTCAALFTRNLFCAAPVVVARQHWQQKAPRYLLVNSGNANAGTGQTGIQAALACCQTVAEQGQCQISEVLPFSTGVIGAPLPVDKIQQALPLALSRLTDEGWLAAAQAIMTTDTVAKGISLQIHLENQVINITGIAKGAGMIRPDMATLLVFLATDANIPQPLLQQALSEAVAKSFNRITVDGDTSTNDSIILIATGQGQGIVTTANDPTFHSFSQLLTQACLHLAQTIVRDGEGATKFVEIKVEQGRSEAECLQVAYTIAHSPLVKTALFASDPNWGRILAAVGRAGVTDLEVEKIRIQLGEVTIVEQGGVASTYTEEQGQHVMQQEELLIRVQLGNRGTAQASVYTCDFSYDYVRINAEYRT